MPSNRLDPLTMLHDELSEFRSKDDVIAVAPDAGATKLVLRFSRGMEVSSAIVLDDMVPSARTIVELIAKLVTREGIGAVHMAPSHDLCLRGTCEWLKMLHRTCKPEVSHSHEHHRPIRRAHESAVPPRPQPRRDLLPDNQRRALRRPGQRDPHSALTRRRPGTSPISSSVPSRRTRAGALRRPLRAPLPHQPSAHAPTVPAGSRSTPVVRATRSPAPNAVR